MSGLWGTGLVLHEVALIAERVAPTAHLSEFPVEARVFELAKQLRAAVAHVVSGIDSELKFARHLDVDQLLAHAVAPSVDAEGNLQKMQVSPGARAATLCSLDMVISVAYRVTNSRQATMLRVWATDKLGAKFDGGRTIAVAETRGTSERGQPRRARRREGSHLIPRSRRGIGLAANAPCPPRCPCPQH